MAIWDRADVIRRLQRALARPGTDAEVTTTADSLSDELLGDAQIEVAERLATEFPEVNMTTVTFATADNKLYTAAGSAEWLGQVELYRDNTLKGYPLSQGAFWDCRKDYTVEGPGKIRLTCARSKSYPTLTARCVVRPAAAGGGVNFVPAILPLVMLRAVVQLAAAEFCDRGGKRDPAPFLRRYERIYARTVTSLKENQSGGVSGGMGWWNATGDLGRIGG